MSTSSGTSQAISTTRSKGTAIAQAQQKAGKRRHVKGPLYRSVTNNSKNAVTLSGINVTIGPGDTVALHVSELKMSNAASYQDVLTIEAAN